MITDINGEDRLVEKTFADHLRDVLGWPSPHSRSATKTRPSARAAKAATKARACGNAGWAVCSAAKNRTTMKILTSIVCAALLMGVAASASAAQRIEHVVSIKFKTTASAEDIKKVETAFADLKKKIPQIKTLRWGTNVSPEKLNKGFTHCWVLSFKNAKDRDAYLVHPDHKEFGKSLSPVLDDVLVIDFVVQK
jgi:hypothetical protein